MSRTVLVTGGAGYIGSSLVRLLLQHDYRVIAYDNLLFGGESLLGVWSDPRFKLVKGDVCDFAAVEELFVRQPFDAVVHLAAIVGDPACAKQPELATKVNYEATVNLFDCAVRHGCKRFVFVSTCSNYGKMPDPSTLVDETSSLSPVSHYAELKVKSERYVLAGSRREGGITATVLRLATVYGVSPRMRFDLTVNEFAREVVLGRELVVFGEQFWRPYCHVADICRAMVTVLQADERLVSGEVFNVGDTAENYQKAMIVETIGRSGLNANVKYVKKNEDPRDYRVSFDKIKRQLGFSVTNTVPDGIAEIRDLLEQQVLRDPDDVKYRNV